MRELAEGNANLTRELPAIVTDIERVTSELREVEAANREFAEGLARSRQRIEIGGLSRAIGELLEEERRNLPQVSRYRTAVRARSKLLAVLDGLLRKAAGWRGGWWLLKGGRRSLCSKLLAVCTGMLAGCSRMLFGSNTGIMAWGSNSAQHTCTD